MPIQIDPADPVSVYTAAEVDDKLAALPAGGEAQVSADDIAGLAEFVDARIPAPTSTYSKPAAGIPKTDLASAVQSSLSRADTSLQPGDVVNTGGAVDTSKGVNVRGFPGANDTERVRNAYNARGNRPLYFPAGTYNLTELPDFANDTVIVGDGARTTTLQYTGSGTLRTLTNKYGILFRDIGFDLTAPGATSLKLSNCFRVSFDHCRFRGRHNDGTGATYRGQTGIWLDNNTGASNFTSCDWENLGVGLRSNSIQNYTFGGKFTVCWRSVWLDTKDRPYNAGIYCTQTEFVGGGQGTTETHVLVDGAANCCSFSQCWWEKADWGMRIGVTGKGGPSQLSIFGGKMGIGPGGGIQLNHCRQPHLTNVEFDGDQGRTNTSREVVVNGAGCPTGVAMNLITTIRSGFARSEFPSAWHVFL